MAGASRRFLLAVLGIAAVAWLPAAAAVAAEILIDKSARSLEYRAEGITRRFPVALGTEPVGPKRKQGDRRTPVGSYFITHKNPHSNFYLSLGLSYPNLADAQAGRAAGLINSAQLRAIERAQRERKQPPQNTALGGEIFIHGGGTARDWTWGCIALDNADMKFLFEQARVGDRVTIRE